jgi:hypothetical protein
MVPQNFHELKWTPRFGLALVVRNEISQLLDTRIEMNVLWLVPYVSLYMLTAFPLS